MKKKRENLLISSILMQSIVGGFANNVTTVFVSQIALGFGLSVTELGAMLSLNFISMIVVPLIVGRLADTIGKKVILITGLILQYIGFLLIGLSPNVGIYTAGLVCRAVGSAAGMVTNTSAIVDTYPDKATRYYSYLQSFGCGAGILAPIVLSFLANWFNLSWRVLIIIFSTLSMIPVIGIFFADIKNPVHTEAKAGEKKGALKDALKVMNVPLLFCILTLTFFCAMDNPYMGFMDIFFSQGLASTLGPIAITVHSAGYVVSRFLAGYVNEANEKPVMIGCAVVNIASLAAIGFVNNEILAVVLIAVISLSAGPIYPIMMMRATRDNPENTATAMSLMTVGNGIGGTMGNVLTGVVADNAGIKSSFGLLSVFTGLCIGAYMSLVGVLKKRAKKA